MTAVSTTEILQIAQLVPCTKAEGPGKRFALWFQGCPMRCPGCCNPEMLPFAGGTATPVSEIAVRMHRARDEDDIEGVTLLGGEPFAHAAGAQTVARQAHDLNLNVMVFSGYTLEELRANGDPEVAALLAETDVLVDGRYEAGQPESGQADGARRWIGSANQRIHHLSDRADPRDPRWRAPNTIEIRLENDELTVNGFPARGAVGLWKRPGSKTPRGPRP